MCYGGEYGPDLKDVAELHGITAERVIELHATTTYITYFLGFAPGFAYLGQLPEALGHAAIGDAEKERSGRKCGDRRNSDGRVSDFYTGRMEIARAHAGEDVSAGESRDEFAVHRRSRAIPADFAGAICEAGERMSVIEVRAPGMLTTVQDLGREGFGPMGVSASGAADPVALRIGNRLVDNAEGAAGLEMTLLGGTFIFPERAVVALTGVDFGATLDDQPVELWSSAEVQPGQTLRLGPTRAGARCYLCVRGGIDVKLFLGSASTHLLSGLGGIEGRALRKGDVLRDWDGGRRFSDFSKKKGDAGGRSRSCRRESFCALPRGRKVIRFPPRRRTFFMGARIALRRNRTVWDCGWRARQLQRHSAAR